MPKSLCFLTCVPRQKCDGLTHSFHNQGNFSGNWLQFTLKNMKKIKKMSIKSSVFFNKLLHFTFSLPKSLLFLKTWSKIPLEPGFPNSAIGLELFLWGEFFPTPA